ncbi:hypothetical protein SpCBS45565_g05753 [Spizellomyces sp. 'palustris']|nr:hypothetical protein SpCBS45565_g05753 [Spizellomyces sp. 'palustris']
MAPPEAHHQADPELDETLHDDSVPILTERTPLIHNLKDHDGEHADLSVAVIKTEAKTLVSLAWPVSFAYVLQVSLSLAQIFSVGHIGTKELAASALTTMLCNVTGYSIGMGMASALDTLCSQAHTGSKDPHALGKHMQRGIVIMAVMCLPIGILWWFAADFLRLMGQQEDIAQLSGTFARYALIGLFPMLVNECMKRYLQAQGIMKATLVVIMIASPLNAFLQYLLVWSSMGFGVIGAPIATSITYWCLPVLTGLYIKFVAGGESWGGWEWKEALDLPQIWEFLKLGLPCVAMTCSEWWAFEIVALAAGWIGDKELAAQTIVLNTCSLTYVIPLGISIAASTRIGNALGAYCPQTARAAAVACILLALCVATVNSSALISVRYAWGWLWSADEEVVGLVATVLPLAAIFQFSDAIGAGVGGILRGCGRPDLGAYINLAGYYVIGLPIGLIATFKYNMDIAGLWMGLTVGLFLVSLTMLIIVYRLNWTGEADRARTRIMKVDQGYGALLPGDVLVDDAITGDDDGYLSA